MGEKTILSKLSDKTISNIRLTKPLHGEWQGVDQIDAGCVAVAIGEEIPNPGRGEIFFLGTLNRNSWVFKDQGLSGSI